MTLVGKILTGIIAFFCVMLMAFVLAVYATHQNWKNKVMDPNTGYQVQLQKAKQERDELKTRQEKLATEYAAEKKELADRLANLQTEVATLGKDRETLKKERDDLEKKRTENETAMLATQKTCESLRVEVDASRKRIKEVEADHDAQFKAMVESTDKLNQLVNEYNSLKERTKTLASDLAAAKAVLLKFNLKPNVEAYASKAPVVSGHVTAVRDNLVEISLGQDQGVNKGHRLDVVRKTGTESVFLGRVEVISSEPDRCVGKVIPEFQRGLMHKGDAVTSSVQAELPWPIAADKK